MPLCAHRLLRRRHSPGTPQIPYLTAEFFQLVNSYLDEAEKLRTAAGHEKHLRNVRFKHGPAKYRGQLRIALH